MQTTATKKSLLIFLLLFLVKAPLLAQSVTQQLAMADSLFARQRYAQALAAYQSVMGQAGLASPAMLLRMAFICETNSDYTQALYYLNIYYLQKPRQAIVLKMKDLSARYNLQGYEFSDLDFFIIYYDRYYNYLAGGLLLSCVWLLTTVFWRWKKKKFSALRHGGTLLVFLLLALLLLNFRFNAGKAIVSRDNVYLMSAPSAGAQLVQVVQKGNRLDVYGQRDIWLETAWNNRPAYVRQQNVLLIK